MVAAVTLRNTRGIDIVVSRPGVSRSATVQVKTVQHGPAKWLLNKSDEKPKGPNHYYVFVVLRGRDDPPEYLIVKGEYVAKYCKDNHRKWIRGKRRDGQTRRDSTMRVFIPHNCERLNWNQVCPK